MSLSTSADPTSRDVAGRRRESGRAFALDRADALPAKEGQASAIAERVQRPVTGAGA